MTLFALQLESILNRNPHLLPPMTPNRIIDRADADRLLNFQGEIVEAIGTPDPAAQLHVDGQAMAAEIHDYLNQAVERSRGGTPQMSNESNNDADRRCLPRLVRPWDWIEAEPRKALRMVGVSFREQDEGEDLRVHVVAEDPRYPLMCVNGDLNFGVHINPETGMPEGGRGCICAAREDDFCICDLGTNRWNEPASTAPPSCARSATTPPSCRPITSTSSNASSPPDQRSTGVPPVSPHLTTSKHPHNSDPKNTMNKIDTPEGFRDTIDQLARDQKALQALEIEEAREILAVREHRKQRIEELKAKLKAANTEASRYLRKHDKKILGDKRSAETQLAEFGLLTSTSIVALNSDWKDDDTIEACLKQGEEACVVTTFRLDKEALEKLDDEELATVGRRRRKKITFWFKPKTSADQRESSKV